MNLGAIDHLHFSLSAAISVMNAESKSSFVRASFSCFRLDEMRCNSGLAKNEDFIAPWASIATVPKRNRVSTTAGCCRASSKACAAACQPAPPALRKGAAGSCSAG